MYSDSINLSISPQFFEKIVKIVQLRQGKVMDLQKNREIDAKRREIHGNS
jgi:hypothetical protein